MTNDDIIRLLDSLNRWPEAARREMLPVLREAFPEILWTIDHAGRVTAQHIRSDIISINCINCGTTYAKVS